MDDYLLFLLLEYFIVTYSIWLMIIKTIINIIYVEIVKFYYIPVKKEYDLRKVVITYKKKIIYCNLLNINYYNIELKVRNYSVRIIGNESYILVNYVMNKFVYVYNKSFIYKTAMFYIEQIDVFHFVEPMV